MQNIRRIWPLLAIVLLLQIVLIASSLLPAQVMPSVAGQMNPSPGVGWQTQLNRLVDQADWIGRGRVVASHSLWNEEHTAIESEHTVNVDYTLLGEASATITVRTSGGYLPAEKLGMVDTHTATLIPGEEVLLLLQKDGNHYSIVGREQGKYTVIANHAVNTFWREPWPLAELYAELYKVIEAELASQERQVMLPADWATYEAQVKAAADFDLQSFVYLNLKWEVNSIKFKINLNTTQAGGNNGSVQAFRNAIIAAAATWSMVADADFSLLDDGATSVTEPTLNTKNEIMFVKRGASDIAGQGRLWYTENRIIKEVDMWLNDDRIWDATGSPTTEEVDVQSVALHELGHWLGLGHDPENVAVMYSTLTLGTLRRELTSNDLAGIIYIYPCASVPCQPVYTPTATPTPTATLTPTVQPTSAATPTFSSTAPPGQVGTATPTSTTTFVPTGGPSLTPSPRSTSPIGENVYLPVVQN